MARQRHRQRVGKERLVIAVRRDFNAAMVSETDIVTSFLYRVGSQGKLLLLFFCDLGRYIGKGGEMAVRTLC